MHTCGQKMCECDRFFTGRGRNSSATRISGEGQGTTPTHLLHSRIEEPLTPTLSQQARGEGAEAEHSKPIHVRPRQGQWVFPAVEESRHARAIERLAARRTVAQAQPDKTGRAERTLAPRINNNAKLAALGEAQRSCASGFSRFSDARGTRGLRALRAT